MSLDNSGFFDAVRSSRLEQVAENAEQRRTRLENTAVKETLKAGGLGSSLKLLAQDCQADCQLQEPEFRLSWFYDRFPLFPARLLVAEVLYAKATTVHDMLTDPRRTPQFNCYFDAIADEELDDSHLPVCCVFRDVNKLQCIHNVVGRYNPFLQVTPAKNTAAFSLHTDAGMLCLQWYPHFLQNVGNAWAANG